jgi:hypothetical protein
MVSPINKAPFWSDYYQPTEDFCVTAALGCEFLNLPWSAGAHACGFLVLGLLFG